MSKRSEAKRKNCLSCNKSLKRAQWFYKNGNYFCNKECFKTHLKKSKESE